MPATIDGNQPAALSSGEFVVPADVVAMIGDGSTEAGNSRLQALIARVRKEKTGSQAQAGPLGQ